MVTSPGGRAVPRSSIGWLAAVLGLSLALRAALSLSGGELYWSDSRWYFHCASTLLLDLGAASPLSALDFLLEIPDHPGFSLIGVVVTAPAAVLGTLTNRPFLDTLWVATLLLSLSSVGTIYLTWSLARLVGAAEEEALLAALLLACSTVLFYFARHYSPYDPSLALALLGLRLGLLAEASISRLVLAGFFAGLAFLTYTGYWSLVLVVLCLIWLWHRRSLAGSVRRGLWLGLGFLALPATLTLLALARGLTPLPIVMAQFASSVVQGDMTEGWSLPFAYLWEAERGLTLLWTLGALAVVWLILAKPGAEGRRGALWLGVVLALFGLLVLASNGLQMFVVYGRLVRPLVPFLCLMAAAGLAALVAQLSRPTRGWVVGAGLTALLVHTALRFAQPFSLQFPAEFEQRALALSPQLVHLSTLEGPGVDEVDPDDPPRYVLLNTVLLWPALDSVPAPAGRVLLHAPHPLEFLPYQYEGYSPGERRVLQTSDISMRLIDTAESAADVP